MHTMQESHSTSDPLDLESTGNGYINPYGSQSTPHIHSHNPHRRPMFETAAVVIGMLVPLVTQIGHAHAHGH
jgi:hypothetical protein